MDKDWFIVNHSTHMYQLQGHVQLIWITKVEQRLINSDISEIVVVTLDGDVSEWMMQLLKKKFEDQEYPGPTIWKSERSY